jgi:hypothetical protein
MKYKQGNSTAGYLIRDVGGPERSPILSRLPSSSTAAMMLFVFGTFHSGSALHDYDAEIWVLPQVPCI